MFKLTIYDNMIAGFALAPIWLFFDKLGFENDILFVVCLITLLIIDTITGAMKGIYHKNFSSRSLRNAPIKVILYFCLVVASFVVAHYTGKYSHDLGEWIRFGAYTSILIVEFTSITENVGMLSQVYLGRNIVPKFILKMMKDFDENGTYIKPTNNK